MKIKAYRFDCERDLKTLVSVFGRNYFSLIPSLFSDGYVFCKKDRDEFMEKEMIGSWTCADPSRMRKDNRFCIIDWKNLNNKTTNKTKMKIGDTVKCVKATGSTFLRTWKTYELVNENQHGNWQVKEIGTGALSAHWYIIDRFALLSPTKKIAQKSSANKIDLSKKYKTRDGKLVKIYAIGDDSEHPVVGALQDENGWSNETWTIEGKMSNSIKESDYDLIELPNTIVKKLDSGLTIQVFNDQSILLTSGRQNFSLNKEDFEELTKAYNQMIV